MKISIDRLGPIRDQGISGLCFTYEGADLLTYKLGQRVSAIDLALSYFRTSKLKKMSLLYDEGGETNRSILSTLKLGGVCTEEIMPSDETFIDSDQTKPRILGAFKWLEGNYWSLPESLNLARVIFPSLDENIFSEAAQLSSFKERISFLQKFGCTHRVPYDHLTLNYFEGKQKAQISGLIKKINRQLERNNIVGIGFHSNDLYLELKEEDDSHATTLVGRRWNSGKNQCEYLMRDNFGNQCDAYQPHLNCVGGYIWVDEKFLLKNLYEIEFF